MGICKLEGSRISKYHRRNNRKVCIIFTIISDCEISDFFGRPLPGEEISVSVVHSGVTRFLFIRRIIKTKCTLIQKKLLRYRGSYLPTTLFAYSKPTKKSQRKKDFFLVKTGWKGDYSRAHLFCFANQTVPDS